VLSGGSTLFERLAERLRSEPASFAPPSTAIEIVAPSNRRLAAWIGSSRLAAQDRFSIDDNHQGG